MNFDEEQRDEIYTAMSNGKRLNPLVKKSWSRSQSYEIKPNASGVTIKYEKEEFEAILKQYTEVLEIIGSYANILLINSLEDNEMIINVFDRKCHLIHQWGNKEYSLTLEKIGLKKGVCWKNKYMGTNGPGEAYLLDKTIIIEGYEHYLINRKGIAQISIPIHDTVGNLFCILDMTIPDKLNVQYYYKALLMVCNGVERELKRMNFIDTNSIKNQCKRSIEDDAFVNEKFIELNQRYLNRRLLLKAIFDQQDIGTAYYSNDGNIILDANDKYRDIVEGVSGTRDIIGKSILKLTNKSWKQKQRIYDFWEKRKETGTKGNLQEVVIPKQGKIKFYNINVEPIKRNNEIMGWVETISDITKIKRVQKKIRERDKLFTDILDRFHIPVALLKYPDLNIKYINKYGNELINKFIGEKLTIKEMQGKTLYELRDINNIDSEVDYMIYRLENKVFLDSKQLDMKLKDKSNVTLKVTDTPLYDDGNLKSVVMAGVDITQELKFLKAKDQFFSIISHELRSPANIIIAASQLLLTDKYREELSLNAISHIEKIKINSYRLLRLINNFLDIQKSEAGYLELTKGNFDIISFSEEITNSITHLTDSKGIEVIFDTEFEEKIISLDIEKYERILLNLLSNATKFTPEGGQIIVNIFQKEDRICISVKDSGIGIAEDKLDKIFEKFTIIDSSLSRVSEGTGLGLNLVKILIEKMDGNIVVNSVEGEGTEFSICLPDKKIKNKDRSSMKRTKKELEHITNIEFSDIN
ncbi:PAS domain S-box protein [Clostridium sp. D2Q-11]|uniref:histidine kinase n=1 Tax=Anaeromonas frigoriresistens TaxID=2683708 RepID=A0A942UQG4_9FIRM|nr:ATP-binding protein [Anaeromonas frigoriresistens]MBS4537404.1 PAS domain S-box protein [Anaeromonas frigoriresistens]